MKVCKQCGRSLEDHYFRQTKSRGAGIYNMKREPGLRSICKECESMNMRAHKALKDGNDIIIEGLRRHYKQLSDAGYPPITAAARKVMGLEPAVRQPTVATLGDLYEHIGKIRNREYTSFEEADKRHKELLQRLHDTGLYEEANNLLDDWYLED